MVLFALSQTWIDIELEVVFLIRFLSLLIYFLLLVGFFLTALDRKVLEVYLFTLKDEYSVPSVGHIVPSIDSGN